MQKQKIVIIGASGLGREILFLLEDINAQHDHYDILGFIDNAPELRNVIINKYPVLGNDSWLFNYDDEINVVIAVGNPKMKKNIYEKFSVKKNILFPNIIANEVKFSRTVNIGKGCVVGYYSTLAANISLGDFVLLNSVCNIGHDVIIGDFVTLYGNVSVSGDVSIAACAEIGNGTRILQKKTIGENSKVGIGSVVVNNVPPNCTVFGNPAKKIF